MKLGEIRIPKGSHRRPKRIGRGRGSGHGKTSTKGTKGQRARTGAGKRPGFEGGQTPLIRRLPKRGFTPRFHKAYQVVNLSDLGPWSNAEVVSPQVLKKIGLIDHADKPVKILGDGELGGPVQITADAISAAALEKIKAKGGTFTLLARS